MLYCFSWNSGARVEHHATQFWWVTAHLLVAHISSIQRVNDSFLVRSRLWSCGQKGGTLDRQLNQSMDWINNSISRAIHQQHTYVTMISLVVFSWIVTKFVLEVPRVPIVEYPANVQGKRVKKMVSDGEQKGVVFVWNLQFLKEYMIPSSMF